MTEKSESEVLYEGRFKRFLRLEGWEFVERTHGRGVVAVIAKTSEDKILFVEQFRVPVAKSVIEFPAGITADGASHAHETDEEAARRELLEETGYHAEELEFVGKGPSSAASVSDIILLYRAHGLKKVGPGGGDHTETITVHEVASHQVDAWLQQKEQQGCLVDPKVYAGLYFLLREDRSKKGQD